MPTSRFVLPGLFLALALPMMMLFARIVPTGEVPDEVAHIVRAESLRYGQVIGFRTTRLDGLGQTVPDSGVLARTALLAAGFSSAPGDPLERRRLTRARAEQLEAIGWGGGPEFISVPNTAVYPPLLYVPAAIGMQAGKWLGYGPWQSIQTARRANVLVYCALGVLALLAARRLQGVLFAVLLLPMAVFLGASINQDGLLIATACLAVALLTRGTLAGWWGGAAALAVVIVAKPVYVPLAGIVFVLLPGRAAVPGLRLAGMLAAALPGVAWYAFAQARAAVPFVRGEPFRAGPHWMGTPGEVFAVIDPALQLRVLLHDPALLLLLPWRTLNVQAGWLMWEMVGLLGILDIALPMALYTAWYAAFGAVAAGESLAARRAAPGPGWLGTLAIVGCVVAAVIAVFDGQYLSWTATGGALIEGVQGRYFIPVLPFLALALPRVRVTGADPVRWALRVPAVLAGVAGVVVIPSLLVGAYYLR